jgi:hypothetical protein
VNSTQNELPQLKLFALRYHGTDFVGASVRDAIEKQRPLFDLPGARLAATQPATGVNRSARIVNDVASVGSVTARPTTTKLPERHLHT